MSVYSLPSGAKELHKEFCSRLRAILSLRNASDQFVHFYDEYAWASGNPFFIDALPDCRQERRMQNEIPGSH